MNELQSSYLRHSLTHDESQPTRSGGETSAELFVPLPLVIAFCRFNSNHADLS